MELQYHEHIKSNTLYHHIFMSFTLFTLFAFLAFLNLQNLPSHFALLPHKKAPDQKSRAIFVYLYILSFIIIIVLIIKDIVVVVIFFLIIEAVILVREVSS